MWAIDAEHSPLYWFPRYCPRISVWATTSPSSRRRLSELFETEASRICRRRVRLVERVRDGTLFRYVFDAAAFTPWDEADGQYVAVRGRAPRARRCRSTTCSPCTRRPTSNCGSRRLGALMDRILQSGLPFSFVRIRDAKR